MGTLRLVYLELWVGFWGDQTRNDHRAVPNVSECNKILQGKKRARLGNVEATTCHTHGPNVGRFFIELTDVTCSSACV